MTENYDSGENSPTPFSYSVNGRCVEHIDHPAPGNDFYVFLYIDGGNELVYAYGDTNSWNSVAITGIGSPTAFNLAAIDACAVAIDQNNEEVHVAWVSNNQIYHAKCTDPDVPNNAANWQLYGANRYQRVDNSVNTKRSVSICVDDSGGILNGSDDPHIAWDENAGGTWEVHYNYGNGAADAFVAGSEITLDNDGNYPTIINISDEGRQLYVGYMDQNGSICVLKCPAANNPLVAANWAGPQGGVAGTPDLLWGLAPFDSTMTSPSMTYYWDADEVVIITATSTPSGVVTTCVYRDAAGAWKPVHAVTGYTGLAALSTVTQVLSTDLRLFVLVDDLSIYHAREGADINNDHVFDNNSDWYKLANSNTISPQMNSEWRGKEHADGALAYKRSHLIWKQDNNTDIWFSEARENTPLENSQVSPDDGDTLPMSAGNDIILDWSNLDTESDGQYKYKVQVDEDPAFGSPIVDTGWVTSATTQYTITGGTLAGDTLYYWRVATFDDERGDESDPYSEEDWSTDTRWFNTTPQLEIEIESVVQQSDKDVYINLRMICDMTDPLDCIDADLYDGSTIYAQYSTNGGGSWNDITHAKIKTGECTSDPAGPITTDISPGEPYVLAWDASDSGQLGSSFDGTISVRVRGRYDGDSEGLGFTGWTTEDDIDIDYAGPSVSLDWPDGEDVVDRTPTLTATISDTSGFESKFQVDDDVGFGSVDHDSGWVDSAESYTVPSNLSAGTWYFRARARDKSPSQNDDGWVSGQFEVLSGGFYGDILDNGSTSVSMHVTSEMRFSLVNAVVEYENIEDDYDEDYYNRNQIDYLGHSPLSVSFEILAIEGEEGSDIRQLRKWMQDGEKLLLKDITGNGVTFGEANVSEYLPEAWRIVYLKHTIRGGVISNNIYRMELREVVPG